MGVDHGGTVGTRPPEFGVGEDNANCPLQILSYKYKNERSVAFKKRQNPFAAGPPRAPLGELTTLPQTPSRLKRGHSSPTLPHSAPIHLRPSLCISQNSCQICAYGLCSTDVCHVVHLRQVVGILHRLFTVYSVSSLHAVNVRCAMCRSCTDVICLILFFIFLVAFAAVGAWGKYAVLRWCFFSATNIDFDVVWFCWLLLTSLVLSVD